MEVTKVEQEKIYEIIQKKLTTVPLILIGTGGTMPYGIPGMSALADRLILDLSSKYNGDSEWSKFEDKLNKGIALEEALTDLNLNESIINDIINVTWKLISESDLTIMKQWITSGIKSDLGKIIHRFYQATPQCVNVITTNYDRGIEYSCDQYSMLANTLFDGEYYKRFKRTNQIGVRQVVNILKVHGSLDWYFENNGQVVSLPLQENLLCGLKPAIITPGTSKYKRVLETPFRDILRISDELIEKANNYLCIGYGFNDSQIQANIIREIQLGKPIVVWTKELSVEAVNLIKNNSENFVIIQACKGDNSKSEVIMTSGTEIINEQIWTQEGLLRIV